jgi:hypothetical protein
MSPISCRIVRRGCSPICRARFAAARSRDGGGLCEFLQLRFERGDLRFVMADEGQIVLQRQLAGGLIFVG